MTALSIHLIQEIEKAGREFRLRPLQLLAGPRYEDIFKSRPRWHSESAHNRDGEKMNRIKQHLKLRRFAEDKMIQTLQITFNVP